MLNISAKLSIFCHFFILFVRSDDLITPKRGKVQVVGLEPTRYEYQRILSPPCLPIPYIPACAYLSSKV